MRKVILYKKKKIMIGRRFQKVKKLAVLAAVSAGVLFGNFNIPAGTVRAAESASSVSSNIYHTHTGNTTGGGGCYGKAVYHVHTGSTAAGGACYQTKVYHTHTGNTTGGGGCYGKANYHTHSGNAQTGGACYTPIYHAHEDTCRQTGTCYMSYELSPVTETWQEYCYHHQETNHGSADAVISHSSCGAGKVETVVRYCIACGPYPTNHEYEALVCGLTENSVVGYRLSCGKSTSTIVSYSLNCGKSSSTVDSYKLSCTKTTKTIDSYQRNCGLEENTALARLVLCNETAGAQLKVKLSAKIEDLSGGKLNLSGGTYTWYDSSGNVLSRQSTVEVKKNGTYRLTFTPAGTVGKLSGLTSSITVQNVYIPTPTPTAKPTATPTAKPTATPTAKPTPAPTAKPTATPTAKPTPAPTAKPTPAPTAKPTVKPTPVPTDRPTPVPTAKPTSVPTAKPTSKPTSTPKPLATPKPANTPKPTNKPTVKPTAKPTEMPGSIATATPTATVKPVIQPIPTATVSAQTGSGSENQNASGNNGSQTNQVTKWGPTATPTFTPTPTARPLSIMQSVKEVGKKLTLDADTLSEEGSPEPSPSEEPTPSVRPAAEIAEADTDPVQEDESTEVLGEERKEEKTDWRSRLDDFMQIPAVKVISITTGTFLSAGLLALLFFFLRRTVKVYNDDGTGRMIYLGRLIVTGEGEDFSITITEDMIEKSCTNRYCIKPGFFRIGRSEELEILVHKGKKRISVYLNKEMIVVI